VRTPRKGGILRKRESECKGKGDGPGGGSWWGERHECQKLLFGKRCKPSASRPGSKMKRKLSSSKRRGMNQLTPFLSWGKTLSIFAAKESTLKLVKVWALTRGKKAEGPGVAPLKSGAQSKPKYAHAKFIWRGRSVERKNELIWGPGGCVRVSVEKKCNENFSRGSVFHYTLQKGSLRGRKGGGKGLRSQ